MLHRRLAILLAVLAADVALAAPPSIPPFKTSQANVGTLVDQAGTGTPGLTNGINAGGGKFTVDSNGNPTKINNVTTSWPSAQGTNKCLLNDGSGNLTWSTLPLAGGGTNATTKSAAFDNLSPMSAAGDLIYGGTSGTGTRLAPGTSTQLLHSGTTPTWSQVSLTADVSGVLPTANGGTGNATAGLQSTYNPNRLHGLGSGGASQSLFYTQIGKFIWLGGTFAAGTTTTGVAAFSIPSGVHIDTTNMLSNRTKIGQATILHNPQANQQVFGNWAMDIYYDGTDSELAMDSFITNGNYTGTNANSLASTGDLITVMAVFPIQ